MLDSGVTDRRATARRNRPRVSIMRRGTPSWLLTLLLTMGGASLHAQPPAAAPAQKTPTPAAPAQQPAANAQAPSASGPQGVPGAVELTTPGQLERLCQ